MVLDCELVWVSVVGKFRPAFIIRTSEDGRRALIIAGTSTGPRDIPCLIVDPKLRLYKRLCLSNKTYFYQSSLHVRAVGDLQIKSPPTQCPRTSWVLLQELARAGALTNEDLREWWTHPEDNAV